MPTLWLGGMEVSRKKKKIFGLKDHESESSAEVNARRGLGGWSGYLGSKLRIGWDLSTYDTERDGMLPTFDLISILLIVFCYGVIQNGARMPIISCQPRAIRP